MGLMPLVLCGLGLASFGLVALALRPDLDLAVSGLFFEASRGFIGQGPLARGFRLFAQILPFIVYFGAVAAYLGGVRRLGHAPWALRLRSLIFLTLTFLTGPGLLVNEVFKAQFHRPRPVHVQAFGGESAFRPFYRMDGDCSKNCSFPSGETAAAFWTLAPAALAPLPLRAGFMALALAFGAVTGILRMASGAHFLSDVLSSGWLIGLVIIGFWFSMRIRAALHAHAAPL